MIRAKNISKRFGRHRALDDVSFAINPGEAVALWGGNGAGKTTLIRCCLGVIRFDGEIEIDGRNVRRAGKSVRRLIGYMPQEFTFHDDTRVSAAIAFFAHIRGVDPSRAVSLLQLLGLGGHERKRVKNLSGGMKQRLALAVAMLSDPPMLILDEPTSNLDSEGRSEVLESLQQLKSEGKTLFFASHRMDEISTLADRVIVMDGGRIIEDGPAADRSTIETIARVMRLHLETSDEPAALDLLRESGHTVELNGHGLCVEVSQGEKGSPIAALQRGRIEVRDFEMLENFRIREVPS
jgi:ABC-type multidrug transport system ATPase subunit